MMMELIYTCRPQNSALSVCGGYLEDTELGRELQKAILDAGWKADDFPMSKLPATCKIPEWMSCETYQQPKGSEMFNGHTPEEGKANISKLRRNLARFGVKVGRPRFLTLAEQL